MVVDVKCGSGRGHSPCPGRHRHPRHPPHTIAASTVAPPIPPPPLGGAKTVSPPPLPPPTTVPPV